MNVKVNKREIENLTTQLAQNTEDLNATINDCISELDKLKNGYKSAESEYILETFSLYLEKLKTVPYAYDDINTVIKKAANIYQENDYSFKLELQKESSETYDPEEY